MKSLLVVGTIFVSALPFAWAQQQAAAGQKPAMASPGLECFERLQAPEYPKAALEQHVDGSAWTWVQVTPGGGVGKVDTQVVSAWGNGPKLLAPAVEKAMHESKFKPDCAGKTVAVVFRYELHGQSTPNPKVTTRTEAPNLFYIESEPEGSGGTASGH